MLAWLFLLICLTVASVVVFLYQQKSRKEWEWELIYLTRHSKDGQMPPLQPMQKISLPPVFGGLKRPRANKNRAFENNVFAPVHDDLSDLPIFSSAPKPKDTQVYAATRLKETLSEEHIQTTSFASMEEKPQNAKSTKIETIISVKPLDNFDESDEEEAITISVDDLYRHRISPIDIEIEEDKNEQSTETQLIIADDAKEQKPAFDLSNPDPESEIISAKDISRQIPVKPTKSIIDDYSEKDIISAEEIISRIGTSLSSNPKTQQFTRTIAAASLQKQPQDDFSNKQIIDGSEVRRNLSQRNTTTENNPEISTIENLGTSHSTLLPNLKYTHLPTSLHHNKTETIKPIMRSVIPPEARWDDIGQPENKVPDQPISTIFTPFITPAKHTNTVEKLALNSHEKSQPSFDYDEDAVWS